MGTLARQCIIFYGHVGRSEVNEDMSHAIIGRRPRGATARDYTPINDIIGWRVRGMTASGHKRLRGVIGHRPCGTAATGHRPGSPTSYNSRCAVSEGSCGHRRRQG